MIQKKGEGGERHSRVRERHLQSATGRSYAIGKD